MLAGLLNEWEPRIEDLVLERRCFSGHSPVRGRGAHPSPCRAGEASRAPAGQPRHCCLRAGHGAGRVAALSNNQFKSIA